MLDKVGRTSMGMFLLDIIKEAEGHEWANTYGIMTPGGSEPHLNAADWTEATGGHDVFNATNTEPGNGSYLGDESLIHAIIGFERLLHFTNVRFVRAFAWDGLQNPGAESTFATIPLSFSGEYNIPGDDKNNIAPGNITWMIARQPGVFGVRSGRLFYRMTLRDVEIAPRGTRLLDWNADADKTAAEARLSGAIISSQLGLYFGSGIEAVSAPTLGIPQYLPRTDPNKGDLTAMSPVQALVSRYPSNRQIKRGRKRAPVSA